MPLKIPTIYLDQVPPGISYENPHHDYGSGGASSKKKIITFFFFLGGGGKNYETTKRQKDKTGIPIIFAFPTSAS